MLKINKDEAIEIVKKFNKENRYRDGGKINNAIDMVVEMAEETNKIKNSLADVFLESVEEMTQKMEDDLLYGKPIRKPLKDKIKRLEEEFKKEKEKNKKLETELEIKKHCKVDELANDLIYYKNLAKEYQANCVSKNTIEERIKNKIKCCEAEELEDCYPGDKHSIYWKMFREILEKLERELLEENNENIN